MAAAMEQPIVLDRIRCLSDSIGSLQIDEASLLRKRIVKLIDDALVPDILNRRRDNKDDQRRKVHVALSVLHVCCSLDLPPSQPLLDFIAQTELDHRRHREDEGPGLVRHALEALFTNVIDLLQIGQWLVAQCGKQIGQCPFFLFRCLGRQPMPFQSVAVTLDCFARFARDTFSETVDVEHFHVVALDSFFAQGTWTVEQVANCVPFLHIIPLSSKIRLAQHEFERRRQTNDKQSMFDQIYAGQTYVRDREGISASARMYGLKVRREMLVQDSLAALGGMSADKDIDGIRVTFVGEEGQDQGGLTKEWFLLMSDSLLPSVFLQREDKASFLDICPTCPPSDAYLMGIVLGLALQHQIVLDISVAPHLHLGLLEDNGLPLIAGHERLQHLHKAQLEMLHDIRPDLANGLRKLLQLDQIDADSLNIDFTFTVLEGQVSPDVTPSRSSTISLANKTSGTIDQAKVIELLPNGSRIPVTLANRHQYVSLLCRYLLEDSVAQTMSAIRAGFSRVCSGIAGLHLLTTDELNVLIRGKDSVPSVQALKMACIVVPSRVRSPSSTVSLQFQEQTYVDLFWNVVSQMDRQDIRRLMHFVTASHRMPLVFHHHEARPYVSPFTITLLDKMDGDASVGQGRHYPLPTASTCSNTLFLPRYPSQEMLQKNLLLAIREGSQGFGRP